MARIRFRDENNKCGELDLTKVKAGDVVSFKADFVKEADEDDASAGERKVLAGEIGEVLEVYPQMPGLLVDVPCELSAMGSRIVGEAQLVITPEDALLIVDSRDPRTSHNRIIDAAAALSPAEVEACVRALPLPDTLKAHRGIVIAELTRRDMRAAARVIARTLSAEAWAGFAREAQLTRSAAHMDDWLPLVLWGMTAFEKDFPGKSKLSLKNRRHAVWALEQLADDLAGVIPAHQVDWSDEDEQNAELIREIQELRAFIGKSTDEQWLRSLPKLADLMDDPALEREYKRWMGIKVPPPTPEQMSQAIGLNPPPAPAMPSSAPAGADEAAAQWLRAPGPSSAPPAPASPTPPEMPQHLDQGVQSKWDRAYEEMEREKVRETPSPAVPPIDDPSEIVLEEPSFAPDAPPAMPPPAPAPPAPAKPLPLPQAPSKYDVDVFGGDPRAPHDWATPPEAPPRVPISVPPGRFGKVTRSIKVWAEPEMLVHNRSTREEGTVVATLPDDKLAVDVLDSATGLPKSEQPETWDAIDVRVSDAWEFAVTKLTPDEYEVWRKSRHESQKARIREKKGDALEPTVVTAEHSLKEAVGAVGAAELRHYLSGNKPFGILSAYKPRGKHENQQAHGALIAELQRRGYSHGAIRELRGQYFGQQGEMKAEKSFLVLGMDFDDALELGRMFDQESVIWKSPDGVVGAYYTDGSNRVNYALTQTGDLAIGETAAPRIEPRRPKPEHRGPPNPGDPWSKARGTGFEFSIDWARTFNYDPVQGPPSAPIAKQQVQQPKPESGPAEHAASTWVTAESLFA